MYEGFKLNTAITNKRRECEEKVRKKKGVNTEEFLLSLFCNLQHYRFIKTKADSD